MRRVARALATRSTRRALAALAAARRAAHAAISLDADACWLGTPCAHLQQALIRKPVHLVVVVLLLPPTSRGELRSRRCRMHIGSD